MRGAAPALLIVVRSSSISAVVIFAAGRSPSAAITRPSVVPVAPQVWDAGLAEHDQLWSRKVAGFAPPTSWSQRR